VITRPHTPDELPAEVLALIIQVQSWKQRLTTELGPSRNMRPEVALFGQNLEFFGDVEFPDNPNTYDWMGVGLSLSGLVMAFDVRYMMFSTEALMVTKPEYDSRSDGTLVAPPLDEISKRRHPSSSEAHQAWLDGDDSVVQSVLICISDTLMGRTWSLTLPFKYELGNRVEWLPMVDDASQGPDYRSGIWGAMLLPSVIRSQYDYMVIRPDPNEAMEYLFANGMTLAISDGTPMAESMIASGIHMVPIEEVDEIRREHEDFISREVSSIPDTFPEEWLG